MSSGSVSLCPPPSMSHDNSAESASPVAVSNWLRLRCRADRMLAIALSVLLAPVGALIAVMIRIGDGHRVVLGVRRVGRHGDEFTMWKFRSMRSAAADGAAGGSGLTAADDKRVTGLGRTIRRLHLDELPQLLNVVRGEMTLVGPRPESPLFVDHERHDWSGVLATPPGIAGAAQVVVEEWERTFIRHDDDGSDYMSNALPAKLAIDEWYVRHASPVVDVLVLTALAGRYVPLPTRSWLERRLHRDVPAARPIIEWQRSRA